MERFYLQPGYSISRIIKGGWHLAGGHGLIDERKAINDMRAFIEAGITTFDCADIYTGVESLIGKFLKSHKDAFRSGNLRTPEIHTKYVPDYAALASLKKQDTVKIIDRSLTRLGVDRLDLVQFAWWDYTIPGYVETAVHLKELQQEGKIRFIGVTNFDGKRLQEILDADVPVIANQVQYSFLDHRVEEDQNILSSKHHISYLCYGVLAGGFLSDRYLHAPAPVEPLENRSLTKYKLIIDDFGGYTLFQKGLDTLRRIADKYQVDIATIAIKYILEKAHVGAAIIGARNKKHLQKLEHLDQIQLDEEDRQMIHEIRSQATGPIGPFYQLERDKKGKHGSIMKYNLNGQRN